MACMHTPIQMYNSMSKRGRICPTVWETGEPTEVCFKPRFRRVEPPRLVRSDASQPHRQHLPRLH
jgi:hypothetical protein